MRSHPSRHHRSRRDRSSRPRGRGRRDRGNDLCRHGHRRPVQGGLRRHRGHVGVDGSVVDITANGAGKGTPIGVSKVTGKGKGDSSAQPCVPFIGTGALVGLGKTKLTFKVVPGSSGCGDRRPGLQHRAKATVIKGYGKLANVRGKLSHRRLRPGQGHVHGQVRRTLTK